MGIVDNPRPGCKTTGEMEPWWLNFVLEGFEDDDSDDDEDEDESEDDEDEDESEDDEDDDDSDEDDEDEDDEDDEEDTHNLKDPKKKNIAGLKSALRKERMGHKKFKRLYEAERKKNKTKSSSNEEDKGSKDDKVKRGQSSKDPAADFKEPRCDSINEMAEAPQAQPGLLLSSGGQTSMAVRGQRFAW